MSAAERFVIVLVGLRTFFFSGYPERCDNEFHMCKHELVRAWALCCLMRILLLFEIAPISRGTE